MHDDNHASTDPNFFFWKGDQATNQEKYDLWQGSISSSPFKLSIRFVIEFPEADEEVSTLPIDQTNDGIRSIVILVTKKNMGLLFSEEVCKLIEFIAS